MYPSNYLEGGISCMTVLVIGCNGKRLMPTTPRKARTLLRDGKAAVVQKNPFAIRLNYQTGGTTQEVNLGIDTGSQHIGVAITANQKILEKTDIALRSTMSKRSLMETRKSYRRGRRYRKVRYRHPKFKFHTKRVYQEEAFTKKGKQHHWKKLPNTMESSRPDGWLPPSVQSKVDHHIRWIHRYLDYLPENTRLVVEVARFDMARMKNPEIHGEMYQRGPMYDEENQRAYIFARDNYTCRCCKAKAGSVRKDGTTVKLVDHHIDFRSKGATNNPDACITVCDKCHSALAHKKGGELYDLMLKNKKNAQGLRDATFMNILRRQLWETFPDAAFTYGNITAVDRKALFLEKTHGNDAVAISLLGKELSLENDIACTHIQQVRKKKRSLHEATPRKGRSKPNREAKRNAKNTKVVKHVSLYDKVLFNGKIGWVTGFTGNSCRAVDANGEYITGTTSSTASPVTHVRVLTHNNNWVIGPRKQLGKT